MLSALVRRALGRAAVEAPPADASVAVGFIHEREPRPEWVAALRDVSVMTDVHGYLELVWEPGDPWIPAQRWTLWEMVNPENVDYELLLALRGPNPRSAGHMCTDIAVPGQFACECPTKTNGWRGSPNDGITLTQWKLFQRTGKVGRLFWIIQGDRGGHKAFLTEEEKTFLRVAGKRSELPAMGTLPYADFDSRVIEHVARFNRLRHMGLSLREFKQRMSPGRYKLHRAEVEKELRKQLVQWLDEQMAPEHELFIDAARKGEMDSDARTDVDWEKVGEESEEHYIQTGQLLHPTKVK